MYIYVSWCYIGTAEEADSVRQEWHKKVENHKSEDDKSLKLALDIERCLPEYAEFCKALESRKQADDFSPEGLLGIRFVIPILGEIQSFKLATRLPGEKKLPVAVAARNWIVNTCDGEWTGNLRRSEDFRVTFVGLPGLKTFMTRWALACAAHDQPLPVDLWHLAPQFELPDDTSIRGLLESCGKLQANKDEAAKYQGLTRGWFGSCASAERDSSVLLASAFKLGFKGV